MFAGVKLKSNALDGGAATGMDLAGEDATRMGDVGRGDFVTVLVGVKLKSNILDGRGVVNTAMENQRSDQAKVKERNTYK